MTKPQDPRADGPAHWQRLRRLFHLEGNLGGLRYQARLGIFELRDPTTVPIERASELDAWESEGGSSDRTES